MIDKLELKSSHEVIDTVSVADVDSIFQGKPTDPDILTVLMKDGKRLYCDEVCPVDSLQEEPASKRFAFKAIPRLLEMIEPTDRAKAYTAKLADALEVEGYSTDAKIVRVSLKIMNGEKVPMATMDSEPVSEQIDFEKELYKAFGQVKDFTLGMRIAKWFYDIGKNSQEPVSDDLEQASEEYAYKNWQSDDYHEGASEGLEFDPIGHTQKTFKAGAEWKEEQIIAKAIDARCFGFQGAALFSFRLPADNYLVGSEVKVIVIKK